MHILIYDYKITFKVFFFIRTCRNCSTLTVIGQISAICLWIKIILWQDKQYGSGNGSRTELYKATIPKEKKYVIFLFLSINITILSIKFTIET